MTLAVAFGWDILGTGLLTVAGPRGSVRIGRDTEPVLGLSQESVTALSRKGRSGAIQRIENRRVPQLDAAQIGDDRAEIMRLITRLSEQRRAGSGNLAATARCL